MADLKHVGRIKDNGRKCIVVFRTLPGDAFSALVVMTEALTESYHDAMISLVESNAAQVNPELSEVLARAVFPDGSTMLPSLHVKGMLTKVPTAAIEMTPNASVSILLSELNQLIAEQRGVSVQDLAMQPDAPKTDVAVKEIATAKDISPPQGNTEASVDITSIEDLSDEEVAKKYRSDADRLSKEAAHLRRLAENLVPTKKKVALAK